LDWILSDNTVVRPDISITCDKAADFMRTRPILIIEILSPPTILKDRHQKFEIYEREGVKYYIVADPSSKTYQIYTLIEGHYQEQSSITSFEIHDKCPIEINMDEALAELD
jgi:Uma2 family endonuclease